MKILVTFALKSEFFPWRRRHRFRDVSRGQALVFATRMDGAEVDVMLVGMGARSLPALAEYASRVRADFAVVAGVAGGLSEHHRSGDVLVARSVCGENLTNCRSSHNTLINAAVRCGAKTVDRFLSLDRSVTTPEEKILLGQFADAVDMESLRVMDVLAGIPAVAIRAISDPVGVPLPFDFQPSLDSRGELILSKVLDQIVGAPRQWPQVISFAFHSYHTLAGLAVFLDAYIAQLASEKNLPRQLPLTA